jgi:hypothetical protein
MRPHPLALAEPRLGVDIGRVIIDGDGPDTAFIGGSDADAMRAPAMAGAFDALARLCARVEGRVWLVSKCGPRIEARSRAWLARHAFFARTGIPHANLRFCRDRRDKAPICQRLGIGFFVDDRVDVLAAMAGVVPHRFLFGTTEARLPGVVATPTWAAVEAAILERLAARDAVEPGDGRRAPRPRDGRSAR